ncbi:MAG: AAA family ATPase [Lachnospiraceae bacterium]|jgi:hypothetical protein|nr:AAA family ATPase [Lachnospiraceae bacterium]
MKKLTIIINGCGGAGKDTVCGIAAKHYRVVNVSSIDPVKQAAALLGWAGGKDARSRRFLADLKQLSADYNNYPTRYLSERHQAFLADEAAEIFFAHIREAAQIDQFKKAVGGECVTLLITRAGVSRHHNEADDNVGNYQYDYCFDNSGALETLEERFVDFLKTIVG